MKFTVIAGVIVGLATHITELITDGEAIIAAVKAQGETFEAKAKAVALAAAKALTDFGNALAG